MIIRADVRLFNTYDGANAEEDVIVVLSATDLMEATGKIVNAFSNEMTSIEVCKLTIVMDDDDDLMMFGKDSGGTVDRFLHAMW